MSNINRQDLVAAIASMSDDEVQEVITEARGTSDRKEEAIAALKQHITGTNVTF